MTEEKKKYDAMHRGHIQWYSFLITFETLERKGNVILPFENILKATSRYEVGLTDTISVFARDGILCDKDLTKELIKFYN